VRRLGFARGLAVAIGLATSAAGCGGTPGAHVERGVATIRREETADKLLARGRAFASVGDYTRAEQYLSAALDETPDQSLVLPDLLRVCIESKRYRVGITYATPWLQRHPKDTSLRFVVAALRASIGDAAGARAEFDRLVADEPNDANAHFAYAMLLRDQLGDVAHADREFREYLRLEPRGDHTEEATGSLLKAVQ
jgi:tetratricopeptide (TPR) repeat protein